MLSFSTLKFIRKALEREAPVCLPPDVGRMNIQGFFKKKIGESFMPVFALLLSVTFKYYRVVKCCE
jgi:hypothetical protein